MKQIAHIRQSRALRQRFGRQNKLSTSLPTHFASARRLGGSSEKELRECALGYRARNLLAASRLVASGEVSLEIGANFPMSSCRERLCELPVVGAKVANCVMLFAYERLARSRSTSGSKRVLKEKYFRGKKSDAATICGAFQIVFRPADGGYAQQYFFITRAKHRRESNGIALAIRSAVVSGPN